MIATAMKGEEIMSNKKTIAWGELIKKVDSQYFV